MDENIEDRRREAAEKAYIGADFEDIMVITQNGWETDGADRLTRAVFMDVGLDDSALMRFSVNFEPGLTDISGDPEFSLPAYAGPSPEDAPIFGYYVNLDERGEFYADVRPEDGDSVYEIRLPSDDGSPVEDGFMKSLHDTDGLTRMLRDAGVIPADASVLPSDRFEAEIETRGASTPGMTR